ncbi:selenium cofactor biosynthesis protein YqeC [Desulfobacula sp.]|uniref:selenium cofactor biosynthesis protein YqeC n=1 Tax=Desulfobacula sp. TaxID=2593537 RepID=UPI00262672CC|nr:selenium cofactor biosynthesis protein YqeC [Desulfobacula sp.]
MKPSLIDNLGLTGKGVISIIGAGGKTSLMFRLAKELANSGNTVLTTTTTKILMPAPDQSPETILAGSIEELVTKSTACLTRYPHFSAGHGYDPVLKKLNGFNRDTIDQLWRTALFDWIIVEADGAKRKPLKATNSHEPVVPEVTSHLVLVTGLDAVGLPLDDTHVHRADLFSQNTGVGLGDIIDEHAIATAIAIEIKKAGALGHPLKTLVFLNKADTRERIRSGLKIGTLLQQKSNLNKVITGALKDKIPVKNCLTLHQNKQKRNTD